MILPVCAPTPFVSLFHERQVSWEFGTFKGDVGEDDFVVCFGVSFAGDPFYDWGNGTLRFGRVGGHFGAVEGWEERGLYVCRGGSVAGLGRSGDRGPG